MSPRSPGFHWRLALSVTNLAVLSVMFVLVAAGQIRTVHDFVRSLAISLIFANLTSVAGVLVLGVALKRRVDRRRPALPFALLGILVIVPFGCLVAQGALAALGVMPRAGFWADYRHTLAVAMPLALVFGLGALAYSSVATRLELAELRLREGELAEERIRKLAAEARLRSLESWIHPHFLFNTLNTISALIPVDPARAEEIVGRFAALLRASLDLGRHSLIPLHQELAFIAGYLEIERVRRGDRLRGRLEVPDTLQNVPVPPMSVQSLVENAVKHGVDPGPAGGELVVTARDGAGSVTIAVRDTGAGFDLASIPAGHGLDKLVQRLEALYGERAGIRVLRQEGCTVVEMAVPRP